MKGIFPLIKKISFLAFLFERERAMLRSVPSVNLFGKSEVHFR